MKKLILITLSTLLIHAVHSQDLLKDFTSYFGTHIEVLSESEVVILGNNQVHLYNPLMDTSSTINVRKSFTNSVTEVENNNLLIIGQGIRKISKYGATLLDTTYNSFDGYDGLFLENSTYLLGGYSNIININTTGDTIWTKSQGATDLEAGISNDFFSISGTKLFQFDYDGNLLLERDLNFIYRELHEVKIFNSGEILVSGRTSSGLALLSKLQQTGDTIWTKELNNIVNGNCCPFWGNISVSISNDKISTVTTDVENNLWLINQIDHNSNILWSDTITDNMVEGHCTIDTYEGNLYIVGTRQVSSYNTSLAIFNTPIITNLNSNINHTDISVFPNPTTNDFTLINIPSNSRIIINDINGIERMNQYSTSKDLKINNLEKGTYLLNVINQNDNISKKLIVE